MTATRHGGGDHGARIVALRILDLLRDGGGVVPAHVVPHRHQDGGGERGLGACVAPLDRGMERESAPESEHQKDGEGREQQNEQADGAFADGGRAAEIPGAAEDHDGQRPGVAVPAGGERGIELAEIENEDGRVDGHVEDAGREREPAFLISPERTEGAAHPDVEAAFGGNGAGQFADHERGGQGPKNRQDKQNDDGAGKSGSAEDVLNAVRPARHHEVGGGNERQQAHLAPRGFESQVH